MQDGLHQVQVEQEKQKLGMEVRGQKLEILLEDLQVLKVVEDVEQVQLRQC
jgi:hypothetical protein